MGEALPSGTVTFLLTDIEGSTRLFRRLGDRYQSVLDLHHRLLRSAWIDHDGVEFKSEGDALLVAFASAADAFVAAVDAQARLRAATWPEDVTLRVRMGLHTGMAYPRDGDYIALALHRAARVVGAGNGGQVLASADAVAAAGPIAGVSARRLGAYRLRDFEGPSVLYEIASSEDPVDRFPALRAVPAEGHNLSRPSDAFVGRVEAMQELADAVEAGRLVTLLGPGGIGKTRLATEFALEVAPKWGEGVWLVDLAALPAAAPIAVAVANALGVDPGDASPLEAVLDHLRGRNALLLLDNCEHVLASARELARAALADCPAAGLLATSRERLAVAGELTFVVAPLPLPDECVDLFVDRAQRRDSTLRLEAGDRDITLEICRRLDGLPLAIELAAARSNVLAPAEILRSLDDRLASLRRRDDSVAQRQRTLRALIDWSYDLLDPGEQAVFRRLAVFAGSFDLDTAAAAIGHGDVDGHDVAEVVWSLVDKSLVNVERQEGSTRYRMLETISAVAGEHSEDAGDARATRLALAERYLADFPLTNSGAPEWRSRLDLEQATLARLVEPLVDDSEVEMAHALARLGTELPAGRHLLDDALAVLLPLLGPGRPTSRGSARLHAYAARLLVDVDRTEAEAHLAAARECRQEYGDIDRLGDVLLSGPRVMMSLRDHDEESLRRAEREVTTDLERPVSPMLRAGLLVDLGMVRLALGEPTTREHFAEAASIAQRTGDAVTWLYATNDMAEMELRDGDTAAAARHQREAMHLSLELDIPPVTGFAFVLAARIAQAAGLDALAVRLHAAADALFDEHHLQLLPDDQALSDAVLGAAEANLGHAVHDDVAAGRALSLPEVVAAAEAVFDAAIATTPPSRQSDEHPP